MRRIVTPYDQVPAICKEYFGTEQTLDVYQDLWQNYNLDAKRFDGFLDWLTYYMSHQV